MLVDSGFVGGRGITFVLLEIVLWVNSIVLAHQSVSGDFGNYRGCCNVILFTIALDDELAI